MSADAKPASATMRLARLTVAECDAHNARAQMARTSHLRAAQEPAR